MENLVEAINVSKSYGKVRAVDSVSVSFQKNNIYALMGPNGAGKSTFIKLLTGITKATQGEVKIFGKSPSHLSTQEYAQLGYVPQELGMYENLSVRDNLAFFADLLRIKNREARIDSVIELLKLEEHVKRKVGNLSGGTKKKVSLAITLLNEPKILFLDEPTVGIEPELRKNIWDYLKSYVKEDRLVIITTHQFDESNYADKILLMKEGKLIKNISKSEISVPIEEFFYEAIE
ncbi:ABC transporter ATP-binding protein [Candidatus Dojkabacteria bacterium]|uniref:ABC transporter ATP-binding protein n=1 Tax=Candidatus Dojkabacteria bacterium TaxID=2099670 RepID=A0A955RJ60_9BACT|nr:ABC transporter ATP-binding protein [Candidatus Dojkabacteria bacterium]